MIECGRNISIDIQNVSPGLNEVWADGDPQIDWGDGTTPETPVGTTASHEYPNIDKYYTITLSGQNTCHRECVHTEDIHVVKVAGIDPLWLIAAAVVVGALIITES
jgi:hypothetical protein